MKASPRVPARSFESSAKKKLRMRKKCLKELQTLYAEAITIQNKLLISPSADIARSLCMRFHILQESLAMRYREAKAYAISALGYVEAGLRFPDLRLA